MKRQPLSRAHASAAATRKEPRAVRCRAGSTDHRTPTEGRQPGDHLLPRGDRSLRRIVRYSHPADAIPPEEERSGVELGHRSSTAAHHTHAAPNSEQRDDLIEERTADIINRN